MNNKHEIEDFLEMFITAHKPKQTFSYNKVRQILKDWYTHQSDYQEKENSLSCEHIVPRSVFSQEDGVKTHDMYNLIINPLKLNQHRNNYRYVEYITIDRRSKILDDRGEVIGFVTPLDLDRIAIKNNPNRDFTPPARYRGIISRACVYMAAMYPRYRSDIIRYVISPSLIVRWHHQHPVEKSEYDWALYSQEMQGNSNPFIIFPELLAVFADSYLEEDVSSYKNYDYENCFYKYTALKFGDAEEKNWECVLVKNYFWSLNYECFKEEE